MTTKERTNPSLGEFLRQEREKRGITIEQVASATKIGVRLLHSLEADQYADLPAKPFIRGFVKSYARFIGINSQEILIRYSEFLDEKSRERPSKDGGHSGYVFEKREGEQNKTILWMIMAVFVVLGGITMFFLKPALRHQKHKQIEKLQSVHASPSPSATVLATSATLVPSPAPSPIPSPEPVAIASTAPLPVPSPSPSASPTPDDPLNSGIKMKPQDIKYKIIFKALEDVWVRYQSDDRPVMKFVLRKDRILVLRGKELVKIQVSNPKSITFNYNGRGYKVAHAEKNGVMRQGNFTLLFPFEVAEKIEEPFSSEKALPLTSDPN